MYGDVGCTCICMWQSVLAVVHLRTSLPLAGFCTNTLSPFVSPYVNVEVSGGDGALGLPSLVGVPVGKGRNVRCTHTESVWCQCIWLYLCM